MHKYIHLYEYDHGEKKGVSVRRDLLGSIDVYENTS